MSEMLCARPACEEKENRINGYCSVYCEDVGELEKENTALKRELKYWKDAHSVLSEVTYNRNAALKRENEMLREFVELTQSKWEEFGCDDGVVTVKYPWAIQERMREIALLIEEQEK